MDTSVVVTDIPSICRVGGGRGHACDSFIIRPLISHH